MSIVINNFNFCMENIKKIISEAISSNDTKFLYETFIFEKIATMKDITSFEGLQKEYHKKGYDLQNFTSTEVLGLNYIIISKIEQELEYESIVILDEEEEYVQLCNEEFRLRFL